MSKRFLRKYDGLKYGWLKDTKAFIILFIAIFLLFRFVIGFSVVEGDSMLPTLENGEKVFYTRLHSEYHRNDIVSVRMTSGSYYVKRIIAVAGDTIDIKDGDVYINGERLDEPYAKGETRPASASIRYPYTLEEGQIFVMGDNREASRDSRDFGVIGKKQIRGKIHFKD